MNDDLAGRLHDATLWVLSFAAGVGLIQGGWAIAGGKYRVKFGSSGGATFNAALFLDLCPIEVGELVAALARGHGDLHEAKWGNDLLNAMEDLAELIPWWEVKP